MVNCIIVVFNCTFRSPGEWPEVELEIPTKTINYGILCKIMDDDHCSDDDLMSKVQLSWPFHEKVYELEDKGGEAKWRQSYKL